MIFPAVLFSRDKRKYGYIVMVQKNVFLRHIYCDIQAAELGIEKIYIYVRIVL